MNEQHVWNVIRREMPEWDTYTSIEYTVKSIVFFVLWQIFLPKC